MTVDIITREAAGLAPWHCASPLDPAQVVEVVVHHTDEPPPTDPHSAHDEAHDMGAGQWRSIQGYYFTTRGYCDIAYHFGIAPDGAVYEGRLLDQYGAHALGCNGNSVGVVFMGVEMFTTAQESSFLALWAQLEAHFGRSLKVVPHSECTATACPGDTLRAWIAQLPSSPPQQPPVTPPAPAGACSELTPGPPPYGLPLLSQGATGRPVQWLQQRLSELGHAPANSRRTDGTWDGVFGPGTAAAVEQLQASQGLKSDGVVGRQTYCALGIR